jgi:hypothetical protein
VLGLYFPVWHSGCLRSAYFRNTVWFIRYVIVAPFIIFALILSYSLISEIYTVVDVYGHRNLRLDRRHHCNYAGCRVRQQILFHRTHPGVHGLMAYPPAILVRHHRKPDHHGGYGHAALK